MKKINKYAIYILFFSVAYTPMIRVPHYGTVCVQPIPSLVEGSVQWDISVPRDLVKPLHVLEDTIVKHQDSPHPQVNIYKFMK